MKALHEMDCESEDQAWNKVVAAADIFASRLDDFSLLPFLLLGKSGDLRISAAQPSFVVISNPAREVNLQKQMIINKTHFSQFRTTFSCSSSSANNTIHNLPHF